MSGSRQVFTIIAGAILALASLQFFLAGLGVFGDNGFGAHETVGRITQLAALLLLIAAVAGRLGRSGIIFGGGLLVLTVIMGFLPDVDVAAIAALHPLIAIAVWFGAFQAFSWGRTGEPLVQSPATAHEH